jgi:hypothetical protein
MNIRKFTLVLFAGIIFITIIATLIPFAAQAQCPVGAVCTPAPSGGGGSGKKQKPPLILATGTPTISDLAWTQTVSQGQVNVAGTLCSYWMTVTPVNVVNWYPCGTPTASATPHIFIPPIAGPVFLLPGVINIIIAVLIIVVCIGAGFLLLRSRSMGDGSAKADDLNPQPFPPKGMGDGSNQFVKWEKGDGSNQFAKFEDGSSQFDKDLPDGSNQIGGEQLK